MWLSLLLCVVPVLVAWEFSSHRMAGMSTVTLGILGIVVMFALFLTGMPVAFALLATGFIFSGMLRGLPAAVNMYGKAMYATPGKGINEIRIAYILKREDLIRACQLLALGIKKYNAR